MIPKLENMIMEWVDTMKKKIERHKKEVGPIGISVEIFTIISIVIIFLIGGCIIHKKITEENQKQELLYENAFKVQTDEAFKTVLDRNTGELFAYGKLSAVDTLLLQKTGEEYAYIKEVHEQYNTKQRVVTRRSTDSNGNTKTSTDVEYYHEWDTVKVDESYCKKVKFLGQEFDSYIFKLPITQEYLYGDNLTADYRITYYSQPKDINGTLFCRVENHELFNVKFYNNKTIEETIELFKNGNIRGLILFHIIWFVAMILCIMGVISIVYNNIDYIVKKIERNEDH